MFYEHYINILVQPRFNKNCILHRFNSYSYSKLVMKNIFYLKPTASLKLHGHC